MAKALFSKEEIANVVRRVVVYFLRKKELRGVEATVLFVVPEYPIGLFENLAEFELYGQAENLDFLIADDYKEVRCIAKGRVFVAKNTEDMKAVFSLLASYKDMELYSPSLDFLRAIRDGREEDLMVRATLYFLMSGRNVTARLPYKLEKLPDGRFSKTIKDLMDDLWEMGISFADLRPAFDTDENGKAGLVTGLVTEKIVEEYHRRGFNIIRIDDDTIVTPLAREQAKLIGVQLISIDK